MDIFQYTNYQTFLNDTIAAHRQQANRYHVRQVWFRVGLNTEKLLMKVLQYRRRMSIVLADRMVPLLKLKGSEAEYFRAMVKFAVSRTQADREHCRIEMKRIIHRVRRLHPSLADRELFRHWYTIVIWKLASCQGFEFNPKNIVESLARRISLSEAERVIALLKSRGYLIESDGRLTAADRSGGLSDRSQEKIALTLAVDQKKQPLIRDRLRRFLEELEAELAADPEADSVCRIQAECIPLATIRKPVTEKLL